MSAVRFAVVGTNFITDNLLQVAIGLPGFKLAAVYSRTQERATEYASKYECPTTFTNLLDLAKSDQVDAVYIASPTSEHAKQAILMLEHGKHVLCEKPVCSHSRELEAVLRSAKTSGCTFMEAMRPLKTPNYALVKQTMAEMGPVQHFTGTFCQLSSRWPAYLEGKRPNAFLPELSNGALMDLGCYAVYCAVGLFGPPTSAAYAATMLPTGVDSGGVVTLTYADTPGTESTETSASATPMHVTLMISKSSHSFNHSEVQTQNGTIRINQLGDWSEVCPLVVRLWDAPCMRLRACACVCMWVSLSLSASVYQSDYPPCPSLFPPQHMFASAYCKHSTPAIG
jgi:scyllo-inositol 2-dehydrogenase (NADP+)